MPHWHHQNISLHCIAALTLRQVLQFQCRKLFYMCNVLYCIHCWLAVASTFFLTIMLFITHLWPWKPFHQSPLIWRMFAISFIQIFSVTTADSTLHKLQMYPVSSPGTGERWTLLAEHQPTGNILSDPEWQQSWFPGRPSSGLVWSSSSTMK